MSRRQMIREGIAAAGQWFKGAFKKAEDHFPSLPQNASTEQMEAWAKAKTAHTQSRAQDFSVKENSMWGRIKKWGANTAGVVGGGLLLVGGADQLLTGGALRQGIQASAESQRINRQTNLEAARQRKEQLDPRTSIISNGVNTVGSDLESAGLEAGLDRQNARCLADIYRSAASKALLTAKEHGKDKDFDITTEFRRTANGALAQCGLSNNEGAKLVAQYAMDGQSPISQMLKGYAQDLAR